MLALDIGSCKVIHTDMPAFIAWDDSLVGQSKGMRYISSADEQVYRRLTADSHCPRQPSSLAAHKTIDNT
jgi:hypothetical protein